MKDEQLDQALEQLPDAMTPQRDLWPGIEKAILQETQQTKSWSAMPVAASFAAALVIGWLGWQQMDFGPSKADWLAQISQDHEAQKQQLLVKYQDSEALADNWQQQMDELEKAAQVIKTALEDDPNNVALVHMLQQVYLQQINLIEKVYGSKWQNI